MTNDLEPELTHKDDVGNARDRFEEHEDEINILDMLLILAKGKTLIITWTLVCGILATIIAFIVPETFTATARILPPQQSSANSAFLNQLSNAVLGGSSPDKSAVADVYIGVLKSRTIADKMIERFKLQERYDIDTMVKTREKLEKKTTIEVPKTSVLIEISVEDEEPQFAADMANAYVEYLSEQNSRLGVTESSQRRVFFEQKLEEERQKLTDRESELQQFQEKKGAFQVSNQMEAVIQALTDMTAKETALEMELQRLRAGATKENPEVVKKEAELKELSKKIRDFRVKNAANDPLDPLLSTSVMPEVLREYTRKARDLRYQESLYDAVAKQYESARLDEAKDAPVIQIVDTAIAPDRKSAPKRIIYLLAGVFFGGCVSVVIVFLRHTEESNPEQAEKMAELRRLLGLRRKKKTPTKGIIGL